MSDEPTPEHAEGEAALKRLRGKSRLFTGRANNLRDAGSTAEAFVVLMHVALTNVLGEVFEGSEDRAAMYLVNMREMVANYTPKVVACTSAEALARAIVKYQPRELSPVPANTKKLKAIDPDTHVTLMGIRSKYRSMTATGQALRVPTATIRRALSGLRINIMSRRLLDDRIAEYLRAIR